MEISQSLDPGLLQAVLADPVLLQAVDPAVLQAVLVTAAAANLVNTEGESQAETELSELEQFQQEEEFSPELQSSTTGQKLGKLGSPFNLPSSQTQSQSGNNFWTGFGSQPARQGTFGAAFTPGPGPTVRPQPSPTLEFRPQPSPTLEFRPQPSPADRNNPQAAQSNRKTFGAAFNVIGPQPRPDTRALAPALNSEVELITEDCHQ